MNPDVPSSLYKGFASAPTKPIKGRWLTIDRLESRIVQVLVYISMVVGAVFRRLVRKRARATDDEEEEAFKREQTAARERAAFALQSKLFLAMVVIS